MLLLLLVGRLLLLEVLALVELLAGANIGRLALRVALVGVVVLILHSLTLDMTIRPPLSLNSVEPVLATNNWKHCVAIGGTSCLIESRWPLIIAEVAP